MNALSDSNPGSITDPVTGVLSRRSMPACVDRVIAAARRAKDSCSLLLFDLDHFKSINDAYGHARGDAVLRQLAERTKGLAGRAGVLVRYGGDEFALILPHTDHRDAMRTAYLLVNGVGGEPFPGVPPLRVSISVGVATFPDDAADSDELMEIADRRNRAAKRRGRACAVGDDLSVPGRDAAGPLLEREKAFRVTHDFLARLETGAPGALRVIGHAGAGHTRFLTEVAKLAKVRGFEVRSLGIGRPAPAGLRLDGTGGGGNVADAAPATNRVLVVADTGADWQAMDRRVRELVEGREAAAVVGLVHAVRGSAEEPSPVPVIATVVLSPLSPAGLHVWLRGKLRGEPTTALMQWLADRSGYLVARAERELARLADSGSLVETADGGRDLSPATLSRAARVRRMLPAARSRLIGREHDVTQIGDLLSDRRLVTLVGPGGIGKTRLALAVARTRADDFDDGAAFVPLAEATTAQLVASALADALDIGEVARKSLADTVARQLRDRNLLLVLGHVHDMPAAASFVGGLLASAPGIRVLATGRERLRLSGEQVYPVAPLQVPEL